MQLTGWVLTGFLAHPVMLFWHSDLSVFMVLLKVYVLSNTERKAHATEPYNYFEGMFSFIIAAVDCLIV